MDFKRAVPVSKAYRRAQKRFVPIAEGVVVQLDEKTTEDIGIVLPEGAKDPRSSPTAVVIAVGSECKYVKEGDRVILGSHPPLVVDYGGEPRVFVVVEIHLAGIVLDDGYYERRSKGDESAKDHRS